MNQSEIKKKETLLNFHQNSSINSIELSSTLLYTCSEDAAQVCRLTTTTKEPTIIYKSKTNDLGILKLFPNNHGRQDEQGPNKLLLTESNQLLLFDCETLKQQNKYKFSKDAINSIDINTNKNLLACADDTGDVKLLDYRLLAASSSYEIKLKTTLKKHDNICYCVKFDGNLSNDLFTGSYDCTIAKWDLRQTKTPVLHKSINTILEQQQQQEQEQENDADSFLSNMTPCFVHTLNVTSDCLLAGIENGLCLCLSTKTLDLIVSKQIQPFNSGLTQLVPMLSESKWISGGNDGLIRFFQLLSTKQGDNEQHGIISFSNNADHDSMTIEHGSKINCLSYNGAVKLTDDDQLLYVGDTTNNLTIYHL